MYMFLTKNLSDDEFEKYKVHDKINFSDHRLITFDLIIEKNKMSQLSLHDVDSWRFINDIQ